MAVIVKTNMRDGFKGGIEIDEGILIAQELERLGAHALVLSGGFVSKAPMYVMRGEMPITSMTYYMKTWWLKYGVKLAGRFMIPKSPFREAYFLDDALEFRKALKLPLIYVGGLVARPTIERCSTTDSNSYNGTCAHQRTRFCQPHEKRRRRTLRVRSYELLYRPHVFHRNGLPQTFGRTASPLYRPGNRENAPCHEIKIFRHTRLSSPERVRESDSNMLDS